MSEWRAKQAVAHGGASAEGGRGAAASAAFLLLNSLRPEAIKLSATA